MKLDINIGDVLLTGRFKNKHTKIKSLGRDELGQPIFNKDRKLLSVRIEKKLPEKMWSTKTLAEKYKPKGKEMDKKAYDKSFINELNKIALSFSCGDEIQYFKDNPDKLKERIVREKKKSMKKTAKGNVVHHRLITVDELLELARKPMKKTAEPTEAQKKAGNYKKKHIRYNGMEISIENPAGSMRRGKSPDGKEWSSHMYHHYGYIRRTLGRDKDQIDVFIKPGTKETEKVYIVNQNNKDGKFDEHKCMLGFTTEIAAKRAYLMNYEKGWDGVGSIVMMPIKEFKKWVYSGRKMAPAKTIKEKVMNKEALLKETYDSAFKDELEKISVSIGSIEGSLGDYLSDEQEDVARDLIGKAKKKSFILRHPWLTGIPTLGIAPAISSSLATKKILRTMSKKDPKFRKLVNDMKKRKHEMTVAMASAPKTNVYTSN